MLLTLVLLKQIRVKRIMWKLERWGRYDCIEGEERLLLLSG